MRQRITKRWAYWAIGVVLCVPVSGDFNVAEQLRSTDPAKAVQEGVRAGAENAKRRQELKQKRHAFDKRVRIDKAREALFLSESKEEKRAALNFLMVHDPDYVEQVQKNGWLPSSN